MRQPTEEQTDDAHDVGVVEVPGLPEKREAGGVEVQDDVPKLTTLKHLQAGA